VADAVVHGGRSEEAPMTDTEQHRRPWPPSQVLAEIRPLLNPATVQGGVAVLAGTLVLGLPGLSVITMKIAFGLAVLGMAILDIVYAATGRAWTLGRSRLRSAVRGPFALLVGALTILVPTLTTDIVVGLVGLYLGLRGLGMIVQAVWRKDEPRRAARAAIGSVSVALAFLAVQTPATIANGIIITGAVLALIVGLILLTHGIRAAGAPADQGPGVVHSSVTQIVWDWIRDADVGPNWRGEVADSLYFEPPGRAGKLVAWWVMLLLSVAIATFAVLQDSTAVVIGAMLIAPLMTPILGLSGAIVNGWARRAASSLRLVALGTLGGIVLSAVLARWLPVLASLDTNSQVTSRTSPTLLDLLIAVAAGAAGAFATVNTRVAPSIAGVAIAVALVPPLSVVGITLSAGRTDDALGALLLFLTNFVSIVLSAALVFVLGGFADPRVLRVRSRAVLVTMAPFVALALVILVPLVYTGSGIVSRANQQNDARNEVDAWLGPTTDIAVVRIDVTDEGVDVNLTGRPPLPPVEPLQEDISEAFGSPTQVTVEFAPSEIVTIQRDGTPAGP
jgi:uncharacterized hydrophobic protein (TIGR00271 family)